jgi:MFS family permease
MGYFCAAGCGLLLVPEIGWRWLFAIGVVPALLVFFIRRGVPESPRWLATKGRQKGGLTVKTSPQGDPSTFLPCSLSMNGRRLEPYGSMVMPRTA